MIFAQILNDKLHWKFELENAPDFAADIFIVDITDTRPVPEEGWDWDEKAFIAPPLTPMSDLVKLALISIDQYHANTVQQLVGNPTQVEKDTWALKLDAMTAIINNTPISAAAQAFLSSAGITSNADKADWAAKVATKSAKYAHVVGLAEAMRLTAKAAVNAAADAAELDAALAEQRAAAEAAIARLTANS